MSICLIKDDTDRNLGLRRHHCGICGQEGEFQSYLVREMMQGTKDEFEYFVCPHCGCLQITKVPDDLERYYGKNYYSMKFIADNEFLKPVNNKDPFLDVGCGTGQSLYQMALEGHGNLWGCDPFIEEDISYGDRVYIKKCGIEEIGGEGKFKYIRMGDSLEHVENPIDVLKHAKRLIQNDGVIEVKTPRFPNIAFDMFETHWFQLDAPRHLFIYSDDTIRYMAERAELKIESITCDSTNWQIIKSFFYQHGVPYTEITDELMRKYYSDPDIIKINHFCAEMNNKLYGDHMKVILKRSS